MKQKILLVNLLFILSSCNLNFINPIPTSSNSPLESNESLNNNDDSSSSESNSVQENFSSNQNFSNSDSSSYDQESSSSILDIQQSSSDLESSSNLESSNQEESSSETTDIINWADLGYATSVDEAQNRTKNKISSGNTIEKSTYLPSDNLNNPKDENGFYYRFSDANYTDNGAGYIINTILGQNGPTIYKDGIYTSLEDVAAYLLAFGSLPVNMDYAKNDSSSSLSDWGILGRVNNGYYSNNTSNYPYEPELPSHSTLDLTKEYYYIETDYGPDIFNPTIYGSGYSNSIYNNGSKITRGVCRFVLTTNYKNGYSKGSFISNIEDRHLFYTYNHYNDFQEYLNYYNGWGERFGAETAGNAYNSTNNGGPSPYVEYHSITLSELFNSLQ